MLLLPLVESGDILELSALSFPCIISEFELIVNDLATLGIYGDIPDPVVDGCDLIQLDRLLSGLVLS